MKENMGMPADELATGVEGRIMTPLQVWLAVTKVMDTWVLYWSQQALHSG